MTIEQTIRDKLAQSLHPDKLEIVDESHLHAGHAEAVPGKSTHFRLHIISQHFTNLTRLQRHQKVYAILSQEMQNPIHALAMKLEAPAEAEA